MHNSQETELDFSHVQRQNTMWLEIVSKITQSTNKMLAPKNIEDTNKAGSEMDNTVKVESGINFKDQLKPRI